MALFAEAVLVEVDDDRFAPPVLDVLLAVELLELDDLPVAGFFVDAFAADLPDEACFADDEAFACDPLFEALAPAVDFLAPDELPRDAVDPPVEFPDPFADFFEEANPVASTALIAAPATAPAAAPESTSTATSLTFVTALPTTPFFFAIIGLLVN